MIKVTNLTKRYGQHLALDNISFNVSPDEIVGFLGPNGAGKTTAMNIMTGFISATEGDVLIDGLDILDQPEKAKQSIGYLPDSPPLYQDMLVDEYLEFVCDLKKVKKSERKEMLEDIKKLVEISHMGGRLLKNLSKGYKQRVGLAQALVGYPKILILDEPTVGLDPKQIIEMRNVIKNLGKKHTILLSSHILSEVSAVCDRVMIINKGQIIASDTPAKLSTSLTQGHKISVRIKGNENKIKEALEEIAIIKEIQSLGSKEEGSFDYNISGEEGVDIRESITINLSKKNLPVIMMKPLDLTLEEIFLQIITGERSTV